MPVRWSFRQDVAEFHASIAKFSYFQDASTKRSTLRSPRIHRIQGWLPSTGTSNRDQRFQLEIGLMVVMKIVFSGKNNARKCWNGNRQKGTLA